MILTIAIIVAAILIPLIAAPKALRSSLRVHLRRTRCIIRQKHLDEHDIGTFTKKGFPAIPVRQCWYCTEIIVPSVGAAKKFGGKVRS
jgi:hypothetical protein